jgi:hypothetical protein
MGLNFYDYHDFQKNQGGYRIMKHTVEYSKVPVVHKSHFDSYALVYEIYFNNFYPSWNLKHMKFKYLHTYNLKFTRASL